MNDYRLIETHIRRARLERSVVMGEIIANAIYALWLGAKQFARNASTTLKSLVETPDEYSTALPRRF